MWRVTLEMLAKVEASGVGMVPSVYTRIPPHNCSFAKLLDGESRAFFLSSFRSMIGMLKDGGNYITVSLVLAKMLGSMAFLESSVRIGLVPSVLECIEHSSTNLVWERGWTLLSQLPLRVWSDAETTLSVVETFTRQAALMWMNRSDLYVVRPLLLRIGRERLVRLAATVPFKDPLQVAAFWAGLPPGIADPGPDEVLAMMKRYLGTDQEESPDRLDFMLWSCMEMCLRFKERDAVYEAVRLCKDEIDHVKGCRRTLPVLVRLMSCHGRSEFGGLFYALVKDTSLNSNVRHQALVALVNCSEHPRLARKAMWTCLYSSSPTLRGRAVLELACVPDDMYDEYVDWLSARVRGGDSVVLDCLLGWPKMSDRLDTLHETLTEMIDPFLARGNEDIVPARYLHLLANLSPKLVRKSRRHMLPSPNILGIEQDDTIKRLAALREFRLLTLQDVVPDLISMLMRHPSVAVREEILLTLSHTQSLLILRPAVIKGYFGPLFYQVASRGVDESQAHPRAREAHHSLVLLKTVGTSMGMLPQALVKPFLGMWKACHHWSMLVPLLALCPTGEQASCMGEILDLIEDLSIDERKLSGCGGYLSSLVDQDCVLCSHRVRVEELLVEMGVARPR